MNKRTEADPIRWHASPLAGVSAATPDGRDVTLEQISRAASLLAAEPPTDDLRLAHIHQGMLSRLNARSAPPRWLVRPWVRLAIVILVSLGVGGVAAAVSGRFIEARRHQAAARAAAAVEAATHQHGRARRWRVAANGPTQLDLAVGPEGTDVSVITGNVEISGGDSASALTLAPGFSWRGSAVQPAGPPSATVVTPPRSPGLSPPVAAAVPTSVVRPPDLPAAIARPSVVGKIGAAGTRRSLGNRAVGPDVSLPRAVLADSALRAGRGRFSSPARPVPPTTASAPLVPPPPSEAALMGQAMRQLRADGDPRSALEQLDERDRRFPRGALGREAALARAEALLAMEQRTDALGVLDSLQLAGGAVDRRALLARADLRGAADRREDALADYEAVLRTGRCDELAARALFGRAALRARTGDSVSARRDLTEYLRRFVDGPRRRDAERMLRRLSE